MATVLLTTLTGIGSQPIPHTGMRVPIAAPAVPKPAPVVRPAPGAVPAPPAAAPARPVVEPPRPAPVKAVAQPRTVNAVTRTVVKQIDAATAFARKVTADSMRHPAVQFALRRAR
ncbi:hypothetical protein EV193_105135 [Herbihabitans rhizosphaerae]|uniref:Uncharacterized protein n=1 Tax=Herbihabitans rhizosphaerae TaxID=1872711 RepID=A0A4Q7KMQ9_9PSEU|nr:hypothetical protein EV193_105135 [Herbihabitans rhizosphaerae]